MLQCVANLPNILVIWISVWWALIIPRYKSSFVCHIWILDLFKSTSNCFNPRLKFHFQVVKWFIISTITSLIIQHIWILDLLNLPQIALIQVLTSSLNHKLSNFMKLPKQNCTHELLIKYQFWILQSVTTKLN